MVIVVFTICIWIALPKDSFSDMNHKRLPVRSKIIEVGQGYGYEIWIGEKLLVKQEFIPAINGEITFKTPEEARKVANLITKKLLERSNPEISVEELVSLNILTLKH